MSRKLSLIDRVFVYSMMMIAGAVIAYVAVKQWRWNG